MTNTICTGWLNLAFHCSRKTLAKRPHGPRFMRGARSRKPNAKLISFRSWFRTSVWRPAFGAEPSETVRHPVAKTHVTATIQTNANRSQRRITLELHARNGMVSANRLLEDRSWTGGLHANLWHC